MQSIQASTESVLANQQPVAGGVFDFTSATTEQKQPQSVNFKDPSEFIITHSDDEMTGPSNTINQNQTTSAVAGIEASSETSDNIRQKRKSTR